MKNQSIGDDYRELYKELKEAVLAGKGVSPRELRYAVFRNEGISPPLGPLVDKVAHGAFRIVDRDIQDVKDSGVSEDELFELLVCAAVGQASRQYEQGMQALARAVQEGGKHAS